MSSHEILKLAEFESFLEKDAKLSFDVELTIRSEFSRFTLKIKRLSGK